MRLTIKNDDGSVSVTEFKPAEATPAQAIILEQHSYLIGMKYTETLREDIAEKTGREVRANGHCLVTMDCDCERLNLWVDKNNVIDKLTFG